MKKRIVSVCILIISGLILATACVPKKQTEAKIYFVDRSMQRLIPVDFTLETANKKKAAEIIISELIKGRDKNNKILRIIPNVKNGLSVTVKNDTAVVNMSREFVDKHSDLRQHEVLTIYQIVNSLTSIDGILNVQFTIDDKETKDFKGFCDMRETFIPDYYV